jgi:hypothetical protein
VANVAFLRDVVERPELTVAEIGAEHGLRTEAAQRAAAKAGLFRRGRRATSLSRDDAIAVRAAEGISRRQLAAEFGLSLSHLYFVLRVARSLRRDRSWSRGEQSGMTPAR